MRMQLTLSYAALLMLVGIALLVVGLLVLRFIPEGNLTAEGGLFVPGRIDLIGVYLRYCVWALLALAAIGLGGGWLLAGRMLRPLNRILLAAQRARDGSFSHRVNMAGRRNELADLADTFDDMLARVERSLDEHRRFAANASHELRTPLAVVRTMVEVARADPDGRDVDLVLSRIHEMNERSVVLTEALLALANIENFDRPLEAMTLDIVVADAVHEVGEIAARRRITIHSQLQPAPVLADAVLLRQLVANLLENAIAHNNEAGEVWVTTSSSSAGVVLEVVNDGDVINQDLVDNLTEPFVRATGRTADRHAGSGLGLAIVSSIVRAHGAILELVPRESGGLIVRVLFPAPRGSQTT